MQTLQVFSLCKLLPALNVCLTALLNCFTAIYFIYYVHFFHTIIIMVTLCQVTIIQHSILKPTSSSDILLLYKECNKMNKISILKAKLTLWVEWEHNKIYHQQVYCWVKFTHTRHTTMSEIDTYISLSFTFLVR